MRQNGHKFHRRSFMRKCILLLSALIFAATGSLVYSAATTKGKELFDQKCAQCHSGTKVDTAHLTKEDIEGCVARMGRKPGGDIKPEEYDNIEDYLLGYITAEKSRNLFVGKCTQCHSMECAEAGLKTPASAKRAVREMAGKPKAEISEEEALNIEDYLLSYIVTEKKNAHEVLFEAKCTQCHGGDKIKAGHVDKASAQGIVEKMAKKPKAEINPEDFSTIEDYLLEYIKK
jgi:mono/diheme cytochrome c family protein